LPMNSVSWVAKVLFNTVIMLDLVTLTVISFAFGALQPSREIMAAIFWVILFFAAMSGLAQAFIKEEEAGTALILKLSCDGTIIFFGKFIFNLLMLVVLSILIVPLFIVLLNTTVGNWSIFIMGLLLGIIGLSGSTTIIAAIVSKASIKGALFTVLSFPVLMPLLVAVIEITKTAFIGGRFGDISAPLQLLVAFDVVMITLSVMLFEFVWRQ